MIPARGTPAADARLHLLKQFRLDCIDPQLDALATELAIEAGTPYAMVNAFNPATGRQEFVGLSAPPGNGLPQVERWLPLTGAIAPRLTTSLLN